MPITTLKGLASLIGRIKNDLPIRASKLASSVGMVVEKDLTEHTPVDTSQALSNWQVRLGDPANIFILPYYQGSGGSTKQESAEAAQIIAERTLAAKKPGIPIYISNVAPYIEKLNDGHSAQEPAGFVERAVLLGRIEVRKGLPK